MSNSIRWTQVLNEDCLYSNFMSTIWFSRCSVILKMLKSRPWSTKFSFFNDRDCSLISMVLIMKNIFQSSHHLFQFWGLSLALTQIKSTNKSANKKLTLQSMVLHPPVDYNRSWSTCVQLPSQMDTIKVDWHGRN